MKRGFVLGVLCGIAMFGTTMLGVIAINYWQLRGWQRIPAMIVMVVPFLAWYVLASIGPLKRRKGFLLSGAVVVPFGFLFWWRSGVPWSFFELPVWWSYVIEVAVYLIAFYSCFRYVARRQKLDAQAE